LARAAPRHHGVRTLEFYNAELVSEPSVSEPTIRTGTQSLERATQLLRVLSERDRFGWGLLDLAARVGLSRSTTHRLLAGLAREGLVQQRPDRRYVLGPLVFELGLAMTAHDEFQRACGGPVARLAARFGTLAILYLRSGHDCVCAACAGPSPYASGLEVGTRLPLVTTAGGVAILISLEPAQRRPPRPRACATTSAWAAPRPGGCSSSSSAPNASAMPSTRATSRAA
jgi:DNA-binding IclR family transcriptional regulator